MSWSTSTSAAVRMLSLAVIKSFPGLSQEMPAWQCDRYRSIEDRYLGRSVGVRPSVGIALPTLPLVARMERSVIPDRLTPDYAEFIIGPPAGGAPGLPPGSRCSRPLCAGAAPTP